MGKLRLHEGFPYPFLLIVGSCAGCFPILIVFMFPSRHPTEKVLIVPDLV